MAKKKSVPTAKNGSSEGIRTAASNRRAFFDYEILERHEAGIVLTGTEIKSVRAGKVDLSDGYARVRDGEMWLHNTYIAPYDPASQYNHDPRRQRKLLMHRDEIRKLESEVAEKGLTLVALRIYIKRHVAKVELGLARGKRQYDKRRTIISREMDREARRAVGAARY
ncbi:SsrA-binding protein [Geodia barretti]|uniref:SsrA-binding protein n=1 Tax=Geodia barretti TaxID=519541 RepID=A0AA35SP46_GEOBA|nr:SsrA-binding protein [Geodia barretti]